MNNVFKIREYLNENFINFTVSEITEHFILKFGVNVSNENDLYLFKYNQISANWNEELTYDCRGIILRFTSNGWKYISVPFQKFFNLDEGKCAFFNDSKFLEVCEDIQYMEKMDGSCIQLWYDELKEGWRASTLGSISTSNVFDHPFTFSELFWKVFNKDNVDKLKIGYTYIFELCTKYNQVVTQYSTERVVLLGIRNNETFSMKDFTIESVLSGLSNVGLPFTFSLLHIKNKEDLNDWVESQALREDLFGKIPEGFVAWLGYPIFKKKNKKYGQYHRILTGDSIYVLKNIISAVFCGNIDDMYGDLTVELQGFVDRLRERIAKIQALTYQSFSEFSDIDLNDKKAYALRLDQICTQHEEFLMTKPFFFQNREKIIKNEFVDVGEWFTTEDRYLKHLDTWKAV